MYQREVDFLRRLIADRPASRRAAGSASLIADLEGIGKVKGAAVYYTEADFSRASNILTTRGFPLVMPVGEFSRSEAPAGGSEKSGALKVSAEMVAVVPVGISGYAVPEGGFMALPMQKALAIPYSVMLVCENMEPLQQLSSYTWLKEFYQERPVLAIFRGAPGFFRTDVAAKFIKLNERPKLAFFDFDPKGLSMAASVPGLEALCLPKAEVLEEAVLRNRRGHLFTNSYSQCSKHLNAVETPEIRVAWTMLKRLKIGLDQEHFPR